MKAAHLHRDEQTRLNKKKDQLTKLLTTVTEWEKENTEGMAVQTSEVVITKAVSDGGEETCSSNQPVMGAIKEVGSQTEAGGGRGRENRIRMWSDARKHVVSEVL